MLPLPTILPSPQEVVLMITAVANAVSDAAKWAASPKGQEVIEKCLKDQATAEKVANAIGDWFKDLFAGKLFQKKD